jgi:hypothetical protein
VISEGRRQPGQFVADLTAVLAHAEADVRIQITRVESPCPFPGKT